MYCALVSRWTKQCGSWARMKWEALGSALIRDGKGVPRLGKDLSIERQKAALSLPCWSWPREARDEFRTSSRRPQQSHTASRIVFCIQ